MATTASCSDPRGTISLNLVCCGAEVSLSCPFPESGVFLPCRAMADEGYREKWTIYFVCDIQ